MPTLEEKQIAMRIKNEQTRIMPSPVNTIRIRPLSVPKPAKIEVARKPAKSNQERQYQHHSTLKYLVIKGYGGKCQCPGGCKVREPEFLTIDHINNDGSTDRSSNLYRRLIKAGFPKDRYRLLCYNCNLARAKNWRRDYKCPHEFKRRRVRAISLPADTVI